MGFVPDEDSRDYQRACYALANKLGIIERIIRHIKNEAMLDGFYKQKLDKIGIDNVYWPNCHVMAAATVAVLNTLAGQKICRQVDGKLAGNQQHSWVEFKGKKFNGTRVCAIAILEVSAPDVGASVMIFGKDSPYGHTYSECPINYEVNPNQIKAMERTILYYLKKLLEANPRVCFLLNNYIEYLIGAKYS